MLYDHNIHSLIYKNNNTGPALHNLDEVMLYILAVSEGSFCSFVFRRYIIEVTLIFI